MNSLREALRRKWRSMALERRCLDAANVTQYLLAFSNFIYRLT